MRLHVQTIFLQINEILLQVAHRHFLIARAYLLFRRLVIFQIWQSLFVFE